MLEKKVTQFLQGQEESACRLLCELIRHRSLVSHEQEMQSFLFDYLHVLDIIPECAPIDEDILQDPDYTNVPGHKSYKGRDNVIATLKGTGGGRSLILNTHTDVVPGPEEIFHPKRDSSIVYGRGACDAKGQVVTILLVLRALQELQVRLKGDLRIQLVIEEELGGNGALSLIRQGYKADAAVILEPTTLHVCPANRGAVWYKLRVQGKSVHMGKYWDGVNAVGKMIGLIDVLGRYEARLREESRGHPLFPDDPSPVSVNLGTIHGGEWPATVAGECVLEGGVAFLPNKRLNQIQVEVREAIEQGADEWSKQHYSLDFSRLHNDAFETPVDHPAVQAMCAAAGRLGMPDEPIGLVASSDARLFHHRGQMPTIVFGPGDLAYAHSAQEMIDVSDVIKAAEMMTLFVLDWCGVA